MAFVAFVGLLLLTGAMRLGELAVSIRRMRARPQAVVSEPWLFPAMALLHAGLVVLPIAEVALLSRPFSWLVGGPALAALLLATGLRIWTLSTIGGAWNVRVVRPDAVVTTGPYRWIRHPNYLCVVLELAALPLVHSAWISAVALSLWNAAVLTARIRTEEAELARVPGWREAFAGRARFVPGIF